MASCPTTHLCNCRPIWLRPRASRTWPNRRAFVSFIATPRLRGDTDLLVTGYNVASLYRNNGDGKFTDVTAQSRVDANGWMTSAGFFDYNHDGHLDLFICRYLQWDFAVGSIFCGDSRPGGRGYCHPDKFKPVSNYLFKNNGDGTFTDASASSGVRASAGKALGVAFNDYDNDGWMDIESCFPAGHQSGYLTPGSPDDNWS